MSIPVVMYHHVLSKESFISSGISNFEKQMKLLYDENWKTITSEEFYLFKKKRLKLPKKSVLITFDDGWRDNYIYAYPILKKYNLKATLFIVTQWIEKASNEDDCEYIETKHSECKSLVSTNPRRVICSWDELKKMSDVFDYHSHTHSHYDNYYEQISLEEEFIKSKVLIKDRLGFEDKQLCWPRGIYSDESIKLANENNFETLYTTKRGINLADDKLLEIKRFAAKKDDKWLKKNLFIYSNNLIGKIYSWIKPQ